MFKQNRAYWTEPIISAGKTLGYISIIGLGLGVISTTIYYLYEDSKTQSLIQSQYDRCLSHLKQTPTLKREFGIPKGVYEVEWYNRKSRNAIFHQFGSQDRIPKLIMQFPVYGDESVEGSVYVELLKKANEDWDYQYIMVDVPERGKQIIVLDKRKAIKLPPKHKSGWFGFNLSPFKRTTNPT